MSPSSTLTATILGDSLPSCADSPITPRSTAHEFHRIESVAKIKDDTLRVLDLKSDGTRTAIRAAGDSEQLYLSSAATNY